MVLVVLMILWCFGQCGGIDHYMMVEMVMMLLVFVVWWSW